MRLLLLSNSINKGKEYLSHATDEIGAFLGDSLHHTIVFIPYAAVTVSFDVYEEKVAKRFHEMGYPVQSIHHAPDPVETLRNASCIMVGGGNTFRLLQLLQQKHLLNIIRDRVNAGIPYIGWSAGANLACPTICTTNDMPVCEPTDFKALHFIPFQINPHYTDFIQPDHAGESRDQRIKEFMELNPRIMVLGLREGSMLRVEENVISLLGSKKARVFRWRKPAEDLPSEEISSFLNNIT